MTDKKKDIEPQTPDTPDTADSAREKSGDGLFKWLYIGAAVGGTLLAGLFGGILFTQGRIETVIEATTPPPQIDAPKLTRQGDEFLLVEKPKQASVLYELAAKSSPTVSSALTYRLALCAEQLGEFDNAIKLFSSIPESDPSNLVFAAKLGQARVLYRERKIAPSVKILSSLAAISARPAYVSTSIGPDVDFLLGLAQAARVLDELPRSDFAIGNVAAPEATFPVDRLLPFASTNGIPQAESTDLVLVPFGIKIHGNVRKPSSTLLSARIEQQPLPVLFDALAAATSWKIRLSDIVNEVISAKRVSIHVKDKTAAHLLSLALDSQGLFWSFDGDTLLIDRTENIQQNAIAEHEQKRAVSLLQTAMASSPEHPLVPEAHLALGNLALFEGRLDRSKAYFDELVERFPNRLITQKARYNLAKVFYLTDDQAAAITAFYQVVDDRRGSMLEPLAYLFLGRIYMNQGELKKAKQELSRCLAMTNEPDVLATASLSLAASYLLNRESEAPAAANSVLMESRASLAAEPFRRAAVFLSALTRYRAAVRPEDVERLGRELVSATARVDPASFFGDFGFLLVGDAFADVGISTETVRVYQDGLTRPLSGSIRDELTFRLATEYRRTQKYDEAKETLLELSSSPSLSWSAKASVELADLLLQMREFDECISFCRFSLERENSQQDKSALLRLLGQVHQELGHHETASICFAGFLPPVSLKAGDR